MDAENWGKNTKKIYTKPEVIKVRLVPEEAVLGTCKTGDPTGYAACEAVEQCQLTVATS